MKIDRSNYEIWFIDWLDGKLNEYQIEQLNLFLSENPHLQEELKEMDISLIFPPADVFKAKSGLNKTPAEITESQFEYLCAANSENDLSPEELEEFYQIISINPHRRNVSVLFRKLKLNAPDIRYLNKKKLLKRTPLQKTIRLSAALLTVAATIALLITFSIYFSGKERKSRDNITKLITNGAGTENANLPQQTEDAVKELKQSGEKLIRKAPASTVNKMTAMDEIKDTLKNEPDGPVAATMASLTIISARIPSCSVLSPFYQSSIQKYNLIPHSTDSLIYPDERWTAGRFLARVFRDKILKEEKIDDSPIKGYEIAEAGVAGLNKLLGWEMAFEKNRDENGELKSIYFSSKILKVQAPVNKTESSY